VKLVRYDSRQFMSGWTVCVFCDKRIKYLLDAVLALAMLEEYELCRECMWRTNNVPLDDSLVMLKVIQ